MEETIKELIEIAQGLDDAGSEKLAAKLDELSNRLLDVKVAQYVGIQGYWIRNTRCWSNCYRQKRASKPSMPAQEVWGECHSEYLKSINNDGSKWDKYANSEEGLVKVAAQKEMLDQKFTSLMVGKISKGASLGHAVFESLQDLQSGYESKDIEVATELFNISAEAFSSNPQQAVKIAKVAEDIVRESQLWRGLGGALKGVGQGAMENVRYHSYVKDIESRAKQISRLIGGLNKSVTDAQAYFSTNKAKEPGQIQRNEAARQLLTQMVNETAQVDIVLKNISRNVNNIMQGVSEQGVSNFMNGQGQAGQPAAGGQQQPLPNPAISMPQGGPLNSTMSMPSSTNDLGTNQQMSMPGHRVGPTNVTGPGYSKTTKPRHRVNLKKQPRKDQGYIALESSGSGVKSQVKEGKVATSVAYNRSRAIGK